VSESGRCPACKARVLKPNTWSAADPSVDIFGPEITSGILFLPAEFYDGFGPAVY
jgi:hypothetical protein